MSDLGKMGGYITGAVITIFICALLLLNFSNQVDSQRPGASLEYNTTMTALFVLAWAGLGLFGIATLILPAKYIQALSQSAV